MTAATTNSGGANKRAITKSFWMVGKTSSNNHCGSQLRLQQWQMANGSEPLFWQGNPDMLLGVI
jgi:hypothetical protein